MYSQQFRLHCGSVPLKKCIEYLGLWAFYVTYLWSHRLNFVVFNLCLMTSQYAIDSKVFKGLLFFSWNGFLCCSIVLRFSSFLVMTVKFTYIFYFTWAAIRHGQIFFFHLLVHSWNVYYSRAKSRVQNFIQVFHMGGMNPTICAITYYLPENMLNWKQSQDSNPETAIWVANIPSRIWTLDQLPAPQWWLFLRIDYLFQFKKMTHAILLHSTLILLRKSHKRKIRNCMSPRLDSVIF